MKKGSTPNNLHSVQFSFSVVSDSVTPWITAHQASLSITNSQSLLKLMSIKLVMPSSHLILSSPSSPALNPSQHQGLFQWVNSLHEETLGNCKLKPYEIPLHTTRMAVIYKMENYKCWRCREIRALRHCWWDCKTVQLLEKTVWWFFRKLNIWPSNSTLRFSPERTENRGTSLVVQWLRFHAPKSPGFNPWSGN